MAAQHSRWECYNTLDKQVLKKVLKTLKPYGLPVGLSVVLAACTVASTLYLPILVGDAVDCIAAPGQVDFQTLSKILLIMGGVILLTAFCQWLQSLFNNRIVYSVVKDVRVRAFKNLMHLPLSYLDAHPHGDIVSRIVADTDQFADGLLMGFTQLFTGALTILGTLFFMFSVNVWIALAVVLLTPLSLLIARFLAKRSHDYFTKQAKARGDETAFINEIIENEKVVRAYGQEQQVMDIFEEKNKALREHSKKAVFFSSLVNPATRFVNSLVYAAVGLLGSIFVIKDPSVFTVGMLTCFLTYASQYAKPFNEISGVITELQNAFVSAGRLFELIELPSETESESGEELKNVRGEVCFDQVFFSYEAEKPLIRDFNITIRPGMHAAIVGRTGCGKTTLINLIMRFYDTLSGAVRVDGHDVRDLQRKNLRENIGMVLQDTWVRHGTIRENILIGKPDATEEEILKAAKASHAHSFIRRLPDGYDTMIKENGAGLSEGQKQLLCITRLMLALPKILILDEATSSIDTRTEMQIQDAFNEMMAGRTSFIVAHRLSTIRSADVILVMHDGQIVEQGNHEDLMAKQGYYFRLYESQFAGTKT